MQSKRINNGFFVNGGIIQSDMSVHALYYHVSQYFEMGDQEPLEWLLEMVLELDLDSNSDIRVNDIGEHVLSYPVVYQIIGYMLSQLEEPGLPMDEQKALYHRIHEIQMRSFEMMNYLRDVVHSVWAFLGRPNSEECGSRYRSSRADSLRELTLSDVLNYLDPEGADFLGVLEDDEQEEDHLTPEEAIAGLMRVREHFAEKGETDLNRIDGLIDVHTVIGER